MPRAEPHRRQASSIATSSRRPRRPAPADDRGFPWELRLRAGAELAADWSLPDAAGNPLFGLPPLPEQDLPESPFRHLTWFTARDAEVFFGRDHTISELFKQVKEPGRPPILLLHGSSGVGKSSLLDAGLVPRLQGDGIEVRYRRRDPEKGLLRSLLAAFEAAGTAPPSTLADTWRSQEKRLNRPLIVILDQVEETFTKPGPDGARELDDFVAALAEALALRETRPRGKLILGFRKEWFAEIDRRLAEARLPRANLLITQLDRRGIIEAIRGPARPGRLFDHYWLEIEDGLPEVIADGLLSDAGSALAPTLQVLLTNMWKRARDANPARRRFDRDLFESLKAQGYLLQDVLDNGLKALGHWNAEAAGSGLPLDFLHYHTTELGTASQHTRAELERHYEHRVALLDGLIGQCKDHYLLIEAQAGADAAEPVPTGTRLAHDLMAPLVQHRWRTSVAPGQRARRVLEHRTAEWKDGKVGNVLDTVDLAIVEAGAEGMRAWTADERRLIEASRLAKKQREEEEKQREEEEQKQKRKLQDSEERRRKAEEKAQGETKKRLWEQEQANRRLRRQRSNLRLSLAATGGVLLIAVMLAVWAVNEKGKADKNAADYLNEKIIAVKNEKEALDASELAGRERKIAEERQRKADAQRLAALSHLALVAEKPQQSLILAVEAIQATRDHRELVVPAAEQGLRSALAMVNGRPILRQTSPITALAFAPDGRLVTGSRDGKVQIWDLNDSNARPLDLPGHENQITALAFALDGRLVTSSWDKTARVWDLKKPTSLPVRLPHENRIYALAVAPDGRLATGSNDEKARVWDLNRPDAPRLVLPGHEQLIRALAFAPDQRLVTGSMDGTVRVWDLSKPGAPQHILPGHEGEITSLAFATDGRLATASYRTVRVWDLSKPGAPQHILPGHEGEITSLAFAPDGLLITGSKDGKARVWDLKASNLPPLVLQGHEGEILALVISPQGRLVTGSGDGTVREWDLNQAGADPLVLRGQDKTIDFLAVASDGQLVAVSREGKAQVWDLKRSSDPPLVLPDLGSGISALAIAPDGRLVTGGEDGTTRVWWDLNSSTKPQILPGHKNEITSLALSADGRLATGSKDCSARVWDMKNLAAPPILLPDHGDAVLSLAFAPDGRLATGSSDNKARVWRLQNPTPPPIVLVGQEGDVTALAFAADGRLVTGSEDGTFLVWDLKNADKPFLTVRA